MSQDFDNELEYQGDLSIEPAGHVTQQEEGDATGGIIPYKNQPALVAYYLGLFSLLPCIGVVLAIPAFILGIMGLKKRKENPAVKGSVHAWIGIIMGGIFALVWGGVIVFMTIGAMAGAVR
tara:strand:+ start:1850 stop:2212 length:363 start_codon:yes stop_codon:yes gene_type:complete